MSDSDDARQWHELPSHLVRAHGAEPGRLPAVPFTLGQFLWLHFDTHAALEIARMRPHDGHVHRELRDPGRPGEPPRDWRPFEPSASGAQHLPSTNLPRFVAMTTSTGLPQTGMYADQDAADLTCCWPSVALAQLRAHLAGRPDPDRAVAGFLDDLRHCSDPAAALRLETIACAAAAGNVLRAISRLKTSTGPLPASALGRSRPHRPPPQTPAPRQNRGR